MCRNEYNYNIYDLTVRTNVNLPLLNQLYNTVNTDLNLQVEYREICDNQNAITILNEDNFYIVRLANIAQARIYTDKKLIKVVAINTEALFSSLFNIPFSIFFINNHELLLHASTVVYNNKLICFMGEKSSLAAMLLRILPTVMTFNLMSVSNSAFIASMISSA